MQRLLQQLSGSLVPPLAPGRQRYHGAELPELPLLVSALKSQLKGWLTAGKGEGQQKHYCSLTATFAFEQIDKVEVWSSLPPSPYLCMDSQTLWRSSAGSGGWLGAQGISTDSIPPSPLTQKGKDLYMEPLHVFYVTMSLGIIFILACFDSSFSSQYLQQISLTYCLFTIFLVLAEDVK